MSARVQRLGRYELHECLEQQAGVEVWKALETQSQRYVRIKLLHTDLQDTPDFVAHFRHDVGMAASLRHPNIVQTYDFQIASPPQSEGSLVYMVTDYVEGMTLADYIATTSHAGEFPPAIDIVHLFTSISIAIDYIHQHGIIHRNIKPASILLDKRRTAYNRVGEPMLTDFGLAYLLKASTAGASSLSPGTEFYVSPEQVQGYLGNERSDIYALGVILYEICTGMRPFQGESPSATTVKHVDSVPTPPALINPNILPPLSAVILRGIAKDPAARFPTASSMVVALAEALNLPVPKESTPSAIDAMSEPTYYKLRQSSTLSTVIPPSPALTIVRTSTPPPVTLFTQQLPKDAPLRAGESTPTTPVPSRAPSPIPKRRRSRPLLIALLLLLLFVLVGSSFGAFLLRSRQNPVSQVFGHVYFVSSGQLRGDSTQATDDELLIDLHTIPGAGAGKSYYAWLLGDKNEGPVRSILLGVLQPRNGIVYFHYAGDSQGTNLLKIASRFLITEEDGNKIPGQPSSNQQTWRYYAEVSQTPNPRDTQNHSSALDDLRRLLVDAPSLKATGLSGGLNFWLVKSTGKVLEFAGSARDYWGIPGSSSLNLMRRHFVRILEYLDGQPSVQADLPANTPLVISAPIALLGFDAGNATSFRMSYLGQVREQLVMLVQTPGTTAEMRASAKKIDGAIGNVKTWLEQVQADARQLVKMSDSQLRSQQALHLLDDMQISAFYAYAGQLNPSTNEVQEGVTQIHFDIEQLATLTITPYSAS